MKSKIENNSKIISALLIVLFLNILTIKAQDGDSLYTQDKNGLEGVIVEKYYNVTNEDIQDSIGGKLAKGSVTYRIYIDLKEGYKLQGVFGSETHPLLIETSTNFFNDTIYKRKTGDLLIKETLSEHNVALDSWITMGGITEFYNGLMKSEDKDGSIISSKKDLEKVDGMIYRDIYRVAFVGNNLNFFSDSLSPKRFYCDDFWFFNYLGVVGPTETNKILIAQLTTDGILNFELNIQVRTPSGKACQYVAKNPEKLESIGKGLIFESNNK